MLSCMVLPPQGGFFVRKFRENSVNFREKFREMQDCLTL